MPQQTKPLPFSYEELDRLTDSMSDLEISFLTGHSYAAVRKARLAHGLKTFTQKTGLVRIAETGELRRKGSVRGAVRSDGLIDDYFREVDSPNKAYWLGALYADGWVTLRNGVPKETGLAVQPDDAAWLQEFQRDIGHSGRIVIKENRNSLAKGGLSAVATLRVTCQRFTEYAISAGVIPRKSGRLSLPAISTELAPDFCRGLFDGDGSIGEKNFTLICGDKSFTEEVQQLIERCTGSTLYPESPLSPTTGRPVWRLSGYKKDRRVLTWMYQGRRPVLARKYEKFSRYWS